MYKTQVYLTEQQAEKIKIEAQQKGVRFSEMLRRILDLYFDNNINYNENKKSI